MPTAGQESNRWSRQRDRVASGEMPAANDTTGDVAQLRTCLLAAYAVAEIGVEAERTAVCGLT